MATGAPAGGGNIKVVVRCRPFNSREIDRHATCVVEMKDNQTIITPPPDYQNSGKGAKDLGPKVFAFDRSYWSFDKGSPNFADQSNLFDDLGKPLLDNAFQGYNNCIFAYGQTGSGKSYSMMGYGKEHGIIPNICQDMFKRIEALQADEHTKFTVEVSYLEIYNERVRDLLNPSTKGNLKVREHPSTGPYVEDLAKLVVGSFSEIENLMDEGNKARTVAATNMNQTSSRSHAVFTLMLTQRKFDVETKMAMEKVAKISLVDLAGSERATSTGATGARLKEGAEINRSLSTLGRVISALAEASSGKKKKGASQVPYRDSVLTWLLKDSLGGNSMTAMIAAISPADINYDETLSTLRYADSAKRIKNHAVINEDANARMIRELKEELAQLRSKLGAGAGLVSPSSMPAGMSFDASLPPEKQMIVITQPDGSTRQVSRAEITERLTQNEKLLEELNQTWEQKLQRTEQIQKEREASLEELGVSIDKAQGYMGISTPKNTPHLVNLSDDPLLAESLIYLLRPGTTVVCSARAPSNEAGENEEGRRYIRMNGGKIMPEHCSFDHAADGTVTLIPNDGASIMVNGKPITEPRRLNSGNRIIFGDFHIYRFNHPAQVRAERAEHRESLLRQSITASASQFQLREGVSTTPTPTSTPNPPRLHDRSVSRTNSELDGSRPDSPAALRGGRDSEWALARREAAPALLGMHGQSFAKLSDEELDALYEDVARAREARAEKREGEEDMDSVTSVPIRDKYMSNGTIDNFSLDTALTDLSTPRQTDEERRCEQQNLKEQLERIKEEQEATIAAKVAETAAAKDQEIEALRQEFKAKIDDLDPYKKPRPKASPRLSPKEVQIAKDVVRFWKSRRYVYLAETVLQHASTLKEAQIMSHELDEHVLFQFTIIDVGHAMCSTYDMILKDLDDNDDPAIEEERKPCVAVRVIDFKHELIHIWSLSKLHERVRHMRQMHQYLDQPEYIQHLSLENPFLESRMPHYSLVGEVDVPLQAVFECRVQDFTLEVISPYNAHVIGMLKLSLEPSSAKAPKNMLKFNAVLGQMAGFPEREGSQVHAVIYIPGLSEDGSSGCGSTQMISDFDESPIRFDSAHSMAVPLDAASHDYKIRIAIFAKVTSVHLDKLLSWDSLRDSPLPLSRPKTARIAETQFYTEEKHDMLARIQFLEPGPEGDFHPVDVVQTSDLDCGAFQLRQHMCGRLALNLSHNSGDSLPWDAVSRVSIGKIQLVDPAGKTPDMTSTPNVELRCSKPVFRENANGTRSVTISAGWSPVDYDSLLLLRVTAERYRVQMTISWDVHSPKLAEPITFSTRVNVQIVPSNYQRQQSLLQGLLKSVRWVHSISRVFAIVLKPAPIKRAGELWRLDSQHDYVKGEEILSAWAPRGVSLVRDFIDGKKRRSRLHQISMIEPLIRKYGGWQPRPKPLSMDADAVPLPLLPEDDDDDDDDDLFEASEASESHDVKQSNESTLSELDLSNPPLPPLPGPTKEEKQLLAKCVRLWQSFRDPIYEILQPSNTEPPENGIATEPSGPPALIATVVLVPKNPKVMKSGFLLVPNNESTRWVKRWVELRRPYLHVYTVKDKEEIAIISLRNSQIDSQPSILAMLHGPGGDYDPTATSSEVYRPQSANSHTRSGSGGSGVSFGGVMGALLAGTGTAANSTDGGASHRLSERVLGGVFAIYGKDNTWLLAAPTAEAKAQWITRIDQSWTITDDTPADAYSIASTPRLGSTDRFDSRAGSPFSSAY